MASPEPKGPGRPLDEHATCSGCKTRVRLVTVPPNPLVPGAKAVTGFFCPLCDTTNR